MLLKLIFFLAFYALVCDKSSQRYRKKVLLLTEMKSTIIENNKVKKLLISTKVSVYDIRILTIRTNFGP